MIEMIMGIMVWLYKIWKICILSCFGISKKLIGCGVKKNEFRIVFFLEKLQKKLEINIVGENMYILLEMIYKIVLDI